ncbi:MAG: Na+/H+ antiporter NhaA [Phycisphaerae bacterium]|nr:Na+/H+ antiporter NhaA [Phycisphaerae bacterium]
MPRPSDPHPKGHQDLPFGRLDWVTAPFARFFRIHAIAAAVLLLAAVIALAFTNSVWSAWYQSLWNTSAGFVFGSADFTRPLRGWITDGLMTLFFFVVALELKRELVQGELRNVRFAMLSLFGALGGMVVPAGLFLLLAGDARAAWGTVTATDTAFAVGCLAVLGSRIPPSLRLFVLSLAIFDDIGAILVIAIGYGHGVNWNAIAWVGIGLLSTMGMARLGVRSIPIYFASGLGIWYFWDRSGIHPTLTGVALGLMTPTTRWVTPLKLRAIFTRALNQSDVGTGDSPQSQREGFRRAHTAVRESRSPVEQLEWMLHPWVAFAVLPLFALANAGAVIRDVDLSSPIISSTAVALVIGKPVGVFVLSWLAIRVGIARRPSGLTWPLLGACGMLTGIGFTMSLFIAELAYPPAALNDARFGILLASVVSAVAGIGLLLVLTRSRGVPSIAAGPVQEVHR